MSEYYACDGHTQKEIEQFQQWRKNQLTGCRTWQLLHLGNGRYFFVWLKSKLGTAIKFEIRVRMWQMNEHLRQIALKYICSRPKRLENRRKVLYFAWWCSSLTVGRHLNSLKCVECGLSTNAATAAGHREKMKQKKNNSTIAENQWQTAYNILINAMRIYCSAFAQTQRSIRWRNEKNVVVPVEWFFGNCYLAHPETLFADLVDAQSSVKHK